VHEVPFVVSLEKCRKLLPPGVNLSETDLEAIRDALYAVAEIAVDQFTLAGNHAHAVESDAPMMGDRDTESWKSVSIPSVSETTGVPEVTGVAEVGVSSSSKEEPLDVGKEE